MSNDTVAAGPGARHRFDLLTWLVVNVDERMLRWRPEGSLGVELPDGRSVMFGRTVPCDSVLRLNNYRVIAKSIRRGAVGFAEAYMDRDVECTDLVALIRFFLRNQEDLQTSGRGLFRHSIIDRLRHVLRRNTRAGSRRNITEHYDLGNAFFETWLDRRLLYSSALYDDETMSLDEAQSAKLQAILQSLDLEPGMSLLEIGSGWGAFALDAARSGAQVTGITLSREQHAYAQQQAQAEGLSRKCCFKIEDYRNTQGQFDRLASVEMVEAVGEERWPLYFRTIHDRLKPGGMATIQAITIAERHFPDYQRKADFVQRYIFPGGMLPTKSIVAEEAERAGLQFERLISFGSSYARTLQEWRRRFEERWPEIAALGFDESFRRKWRYYLAYCEAGFLEGAIDVGLYRMTRPEVGGLKA